MVYKNGIKSFMVYMICMIYAEVDVEVHPSLKQYQK